MTRVQRKKTKVPVSVWLAALSIVAIIVLLSGYTSEKIYWAPERLESIQDNGLIAIGSSLVHYGFLFDDDFESLAKGRGRTVQFVRLSVRKNNMDYTLPSLLDEIYHSNPRWVFLQAEPFFIDFRLEKATRNKRLLRVVYNMQFFLTQIFLKIKSICFEINLLEINQDDTGLYLNKVVTEEWLMNRRRSYILKPAVFPEYVESFIKRAKEKGVQVILLEMNRSKVENDYQGRSFRVQFNDLLGQVSTRYQIPLWQFEGNLPIDHYVDHAHLNQKGRVAFNDWFLSKLGREYGDD
ncbi:MAG: hypothetical protein V3T30_06530 [Thermodesulfobacteriota bacterium]